MNTPGPWGICQRSGLRTQLSNLVIDGQTGLLVHPRWYEPRHPQETPPTAKDDVTVLNQAPDNDNWKDSVLRYPVFDFRLNAFDGSQAIPILIAANGTLDGLFAFGVDPGSGEIDFGVGSGGLVVNP